MKPSEIIKLAIEKAAGTTVEFVVEHPAEEAHGDYATNIALVVGGKPREAAEKIKGELEEDENLKKLVDKIEIAGPGFINFWLKKEWLVEATKQVLVGGENYGRNEWLADKKVMVEFTDPNPFKEFHIGHLMSNGIGESLARLFEFSGAILKRSCYQGDMGMHVAKSIWGMQEKMRVEEVSLVDLEKKDLKERVHFLGQAYALGATRHEEDEKAKKEMNELNKKIYERSDEEINKLFDVGKQWSLEYFETIYQKLGTKFDYYFFESEAGERGKKLVEEYIKKGIFEESQGAVVFPGEKYGLHTRVFLNSLRLPTYEAKELGLSKAKYEKFAYDWSVIVTGNEINDYFKVLLKAMSLIYPDLAEKTTHIGHGMLRLKTGKMSSRTGKVVTGEGLIEDVSGEIKKKMQDGEVRVEEIEKDRVVTDIAIGAIKYSMLRQSLGKDIIFDFESSLSFEGDSGPYLQYSYARANSVLEKAATKMNKELLGFDLNEEELAIVRWIYRFGEIVEVAARDLSPNLVCSYLIELAQRFNVFYNKHAILKAGREQLGLRLLLTEAVRQILANGLMLLGIRVVEKM